MLEKLFFGSGPEPKRKLIAELTPELKKYEVRKIAEALETDYLPHDLLRLCGYDFKTCSLVAYRMVAELHSGCSEERRERIMQFIGCERSSPLIPVRYAGTIGCDRIIVFNRCAFSSPYSMIGIKGECNPEITKILKGLKCLGYDSGWTRFKLDPGTTDDMTAMLALGLEKNFHLIIAHLPHDSGPVILFDWDDC